MKTMNDYRSLTLDEIKCLERHGCVAEDWLCVSVAEDFDAGFVRNASFYGCVSLGVFDKSIELEDGFFRHSGVYNAVLRNVKVGDNCLIENVGNYISNYEIGENSILSNIGVLTANEGTTFGQGGLIAVLNEAGDGNVVCFPELTSQMAAFMVSVADDKELWGKMKTMVRNKISEAAPTCGMVGYGAKIVNTKSIIDVLIDDYCEINGASSLNNCSFFGADEASVFIGTDVICENVVASAGASIINGAKLDNCFVGEACHVGQGFSAENCVMFANSYFDNGEACAAFCGPFTVSHHKTTLLIGGMYSFYNAGSNTNYSNHAYKIGPIHWGILERGSKTASGAHLLMPVTIGSFSMCMGKIQNHPDTSSLPFSYIFGNGDETFVVPGRNIATVGTYRDVNKWPMRDKRLCKCRCCKVNMEWLSPFVINEVLEGKEFLKDLQMEQGEDVKEYKRDGLTIKRKHLEAGLHYYNMVIRMFIGRCVEKHRTKLPVSSVGVGEWDDLSGLLLPMSMEQYLIDAVKNDEITTVEQLEEYFVLIHQQYEDYCWSYAYSLILRHYQLDSLTDEDVESILEDYSSALDEWKVMIREDAECEYDMGDMDDETLQEFLGMLN